MNIAYIVFAESIFSPILYNQVINLLKLITNGSKYNIYLLWFCPIKIYVTKKHDITDLRSNLAKDKVNLHVIPIFYREHWFCAKWYHVPLIYQIIFPIIKLNKKYNFAILHVRSFPGAIPLHIMARFYGAKIILDTRSDFVSENMLAAWKNDLLTIKYWKKQENKLYNISKKIVVVSDVYKDEKLSMFNDKVEIIPNNVFIASNSAYNNFKYTYRKQKNILNKIVFCYLGSFNYAWNKIETYIKFFESNLYLLDNIHFYIITQNKEVVKDILKTSHVLTGKYTLESVKSEDVPEYLSVADIGLQLMAHQDSRIGIKVVEYLAAGLPVIVNQNVRGAASIIEKNKLGIVIGNDYVLPKYKFDELIKSKDIISKRCRKFAIDNFSNEAIAQRYIKLYDAIIHNGE